MKIDKVASLADVVLGLWLLLSAFLWHQSEQQVINVAAVGILSAALGATAYRGHTWARFIVAALGVWLFVSAWMIAGAPVATVINSLTIGTLLFGFSALPTGRGRAIGDSPLRPPVG